MGPSHGLAAALAGAGAAVAGGAPLHVTLMVAAGAVATGRGDVSPDVDQKVRLLPHRGLTHWPGWALLGWLLLPHVDPGARWLAVALLAGWTSHLLGDLLFGRLPLTPWGSHRVGLRLRTNGRVERLVVRPLLAAGLVLLLLLEVRALTA